MLINIYSGLSKLSSANLAALVESWLSNTGRSKRSFDIFAI